MSNYRSGIARKASGRFDICAAISSNRGGFTITCSVGKVNPKCAFGPTIRFSAPISPISIHITGGA